MCVNAYKDLNLREGAGELEIRAAFRRAAKDNHPDSCSTGDVAKFRKACSAYKTLMKEAAVRKRALFTASSSVPYVFDGQRACGLDLYFDIALVRPENGEGFTLSLPTVSQTACPRCFGQGRTLARRSGGSDLYRPTVCPKCAGKGAVSENKVLSVAVTSEMAERGKFRLKGAGGYLPKEARRGDLIVAMRWVDTLPQGH